MRTKNRRRRHRQTCYWVFAKPDQMKGHKFTDDVALCKAASKSEAIRKFSKLYKNIEDKDVWVLNPTKKGQYYYCSDIWILTDY